MLDAHEYAGGYLSVAYALRHPDRVSKLILLSPAGVPTDPKAVNESADPELAVASETEPEPTTKPSLFRQFATYGWEAGWSPFQVVRSASMFGPMLVARVSVWSNV